jgi:hypothetical protein
LQKASTIGKSAIGRRRAKRKHEWRKIALPGENFSGVIHQKIFL